MSQEAEPWSKKYSGPRLPIPPLDDKVSGGVPQKEFRSSTCLIRRSPHQWGSRIGTARLRKGLRTHKSHPQNRSGPKLVISDGVLGSRTTCHAQASAHMCSSPNPSKLGPPGHGRKRSENTFWGGCSTPRNNARQMVREPWVQKGSQNRPTGFRRSPPAIRGARADIGRNRPKSAQLRPD